jgi:Asp-tRNA(Asn)/Glu-tRNA(Gln) amidotransferase A subunit family amidase
MSDPSRLSATEAAHAIAAGRLRPEALMEACLDRIAAREPVVRAFATLDPALARASVASAQATGPLPPCVRVVAARIEWEPLGATEDGDGPIRS